MHTIIATAHLTGAERLTERARVAADKTSVVHFWFRKINEKLAKSTSVRQTAVSAASWY